MDRIAAIRASLRGFVCGLFGLLPVLGLVPAIISLRCWWRVQIYYQDWNPARRYLNWGALLSALGLLITLMAGAGIVLALLF
jgi:hypothetical protein